MQPPQASARSWGRNRRVDDIAGLVRQHDCLRAEAVEQAIGDLPAITPSPDREALRIGRIMMLVAAAARSTKTMIWKALLSSWPAGAPGWERRRSSGISPSCAVEMASISLPTPRPFAIARRVLAAGARAIAAGQIAPRHTGGHQPEDPFQHAAIINSRCASGGCWRRVAMQPAWTLQSISLRQAAREGHKRARAQLGSQSPARHC